MKLRIGELLQLTLCRLSLDGFGESVGATSFQGRASTNKEP
ncbi:hypothetical protein OAQ84_00455 [Bdellovibrionales bacterium]|nr:hypothetical protein [Bdellovibrionales bacterium]